MAVIKLRFSIRDLIFITAVTGLGIGWWVDHRRLEQELREANRISAIRQELLDLSNETFGRMQK